MSSWQRIAAAGSNCYGRLLGSLPGFLCCWGNRALETRLFKRGRRRRGGGAGWAARPHNSGVPRRAHQVREAGGGDAAKREGREGRAHLGKAVPSRPVEAGEGFLHGACSALSAHFIRGQGK